MKPKARKKSWVIMATHGTEVMAMSITAHTMDEAIKEAKENWNSQGYKLSILTV